MSPATSVAQECVEGYVFVRDPPALLLLRRPPARGSIWAPVSGKVDPSDADLIAALRRELAEETGFDAPRSVTDLDWSVGFEGPGGAPWRLHAFAVELDSERAPTLSEEHVEFHWWPPAIARSRLHYEDNRQAVDRIWSPDGTPLGRVAPPF